MPDPNSFSLSELTEKLQQHGLSTLGERTELVARLVRVNPNLWTMQRDSARASTSRGEDNTRRLKDNASILNREMELCKREKELSERELELTRLELAMLRASQFTDVQNPERRDGPVTCHRTDKPTLETHYKETTVVTTKSNEEATAQRSVGTDAILIPKPRPRMGITMLANLLNDFDGSSSDYETWEKQVKLLKTTYDLDDDHAKILVSTKLKKNAFEWFHSRPDYIGMTFDALLDALRGMFYHPQSKMILREKFESRTWREDETFCDYLHEKMIMGNRVSINSDEMLDYVIDGIPDERLRSQAYKRRLNTTEELLEAFGKMTLQDRRAGNSNRPTRGNIVRKKDAASATTEKSKSRKPVTNSKRCFNCGLRDHVSVDCPTKTLGTKCFACGEHGHVANKCPEKENKRKTVCDSVEENVSTNYTKDVIVEGKTIAAFIDTRSKVSLMRADEYVKIGSPRYNACKISFRNVDSRNITTLGEFQTNIQIDGHSFPIVIRIVSDTVLRQKLLIGTDFLNSVELNVKAGKISVSPITG